MDPPAQPAPTAANMNRWPSVRGPLLARTPNLFENTSLAPPSPPSDLTPSQRHRDPRAVQRRHERRQHTREEAEGHAREDAWLEKRRLDGLKADASWDALQAYQVGLEPAARAYAEAFGAWKMKAESGEADAEVFELFEQHVRNAMRASLAETRRWDMISWFRFDNDNVDVVVGAVDAAVERMAQYCFDEAEFLRDYHFDEYTANRTDHDDCGLDQPCRSEFSFAIESQMRFGYERQEVEGEYHDFGFRNYTHTITTLADLEHLRANFEVRKLRLAHADRKDRFGHGKIDDKGWVYSLDGQMVEFISQATEMASPNVIQEAIVDELDALALMADTRTAANARTMSLTLAFGPLWRDMTTYQSDLMNRKHRIEAENTQLQQFKYLYNMTKESGTPFLLDAVLVVAETGIRLRAAMAEGVGSENPDELEVEGELMEEIADRLIEVGVHGRKGWYLLPEDREEDGDGEGMETGDAVEGEEDEGFEGTEQ